MTLATFCKWIAAAALLALAGVLQASEPRHDSWGPDTVLLDDLQQRYQPVPFDHKTHAQMAQMWSGCVTCHHRSPQPGAHAAALPEAQRHDQAAAGEVPACKSCHPIGGADELISIDMPSLKGAYHRQCLNCHREWAGANNCVACHEPVEGGVDAEIAPTRDDITGRMHPPIAAPREKTYRARFTPVAGGNVLFRHDEHVNRFGLRCVECHRRDSCSSCHAPDAQANTHKPLQTAWNWEKSHDPCLGCHAQHRCEHCHYRDDQPPPPPFDHRATGQVLDDKHQGFNCRQCHGDAPFALVPTCGDATCHAKDPSIALPGHRPGPQVAFTLSARRRPDAAEVLAATRRVYPVLLPRSDGAAKLVMRLDFPARVPWRPQPSAQVNSAQPPDAPLPPQPLPLQQRAPRPTTASDAQADCTTSACHADLKAFAVVHGPVAQDGCDACHRLADPQQHRFELLRQQESMCAYCHESVGSAMPVVHEPVKRGECLGCHNPHGGPDRSLSREDSVPKLCGRCHDSVSAQAFLHKPVEQGLCLSCHAAHGALLPKLLDAVGAELCVSCHRDFDRTLQQATFTHQAMQEGCTRCHNVHGSSHRLALQDDVVALCQSCHEPVKQQMQQATVTHRVTQQQEACMTCHTPHGGTQSALMRDTQAALCLSCHDKPQQSVDGRTIAAPAELLNVSTFKHAPVGQGDCSGCHAVHGATQPDLLRAPYARAFYQPYSDQAYALCFACHKTQAMQSLRDSEQTQFRNGDLNLHYVHVQGPRGRSCDVCHSPHASEAPMVVREHVQFRTWTFAIGFRKSDTGGSCNPGCHLPLRYDRVEPVSQPTSLLLAREQAESIKSASPEPVQLWWEGLDAGGRAVRVPEPRMRTVLVFARGHADDHDDLFAALQQALRGARDVQMLLVLDQPAPLMTLPPTWRVIHDVDEALAKQVQLHGRPTTIVFSGEGLQLVRIGGTGAALTLKLRGYLLPGEPSEAMIITDRK